MQSCKSNFLNRLNRKQQETADSFTHYSSCRSSQSGFHCTYHKLPVLISEMHHLQFHSYLQNPTFDPKTLTSNYDLNWLKSMSMDLAQSERKSEKRSCAGTDLIADCLCILKIFLPWTLWPKILKILLQNQIESCTASENKSGVKESRNVQHEVEELQLSRWIANLERERKGNIEYLEPYF
jgi:hypothetical protein